MSDMKAEILKLKQQLQNLGYHGYQIDSVIEDEVGISNIDGLDDKQSEQVAEAMQGYIKFAAKALQAGGLCSS